MLIVVSLKLLNGFFCAKLVHLFRASRRRVLIPRDRPSLSNFAQTPRRRSGVSTSRPLIVVAPQHFPRCGVHKVNLPASNAGQGFVAPVVRRNFFCREALHAEAGVWAAVDERGHMVLCRIRPPVQLRSVWGASFRGEPNAGTGIRHSLDFTWPGPMLAILCKCSSASRR